MRRRGTSVCRTPVVRAVGPGLTIGHRVGCADETVIVRCYHRGPKCLKLGNWSRWDRSERGTAAELGVLALPIMLVLLLTVALGRFASARSEVDAAARDAARAASFARSAGAAASAAEAAAAASLDSDGLACQRFTVSVDLANFTPGGEVVAHVHCTISLADLTLLRLPASPTISAQFREPVDTYLGVQ